MGSRYTFSLISKAIFIGDSLGIHTPLALIVEYIFVILCVNFIRD